MAHTLTKIYVHLIWHIRTDSQKIRTEDKADLYKFMGGIIKENGCLPCVIGGTDNHVHLLISLSVTQTLSKVVAAIKRSSSMWMSNRDARYSHFYWQSGYAAFSVSESRLETVKEYIQGQEEHHHKMSFEEEYRRFLDLHKIKYDERFLFCD